MATIVKNFKVFIWLLGINLLFVNSIFSQAPEIKVWNELEPITWVTAGMEDNYNTTQGPSNWLSPNNYYEGMWRIRFELAEDLPSDDSLGLSFGIFGQDGTYEEMFTLHHAYLSNQYPVETFAEKPYDFYSSPERYHVDFSDEANFLRWAFATWVYHDGTEYHLGSAPAEGWNLLEVYANTTLRAQWLPASVRVTVIAVAEGATFSGWSNYVHERPTYGIDYVNKKTDKVVPSTDEYSVNSNMSGAVSGTGVTITLTPGTDVYFRTKASGQIPVSTIQHLVVPAIPSAPSYSVNYLTGKTDEVVPTTVEYSPNSNMSGAQSGAGTTLTLTPGTDLYFRVKASSSNFASNTFFLDVPSAPPAPSYTINYIDERTNETVPSTVEYSQNSNMSGAISGAGTTVTVTPGTDLYFRTKASAGTFASSAYHLDVAGRVNAPEFHINYETSMTEEGVSSGVAWSTNPDLSSYSVGTGQALTLIPGTDLYFKTLATSITFASDIFTLDVPLLPAAPQITIDYLNEETVQSVTSNMLYSTASNMAGALNGSGNKLSLTPGEDLYIMYQSTASSFASQVNHLVVPGRPYILAISPDASVEVPFKFKVFFPGDYTGLTVSDIDIQNCFVNDINSDTIVVIPDQIGSLVTVSIPANAINEGNFESNIAQVFYGITDIKEIENAMLKIYPNPSFGNLNIQVENIPGGIYTVELYNINGTVIFNRSGNYQDGTIVLNDLIPGIYVLRLNTENSVITKKVIVQ